MCMGIVGERDDQPRRGLLGSTGSDQQARPAEEHATGVQVQCLQLPRLVVIDDGERGGQADARDRGALGIDDLQLVGAQQVHLGGKVPLELAQVEGEGAAGSEACGRRWGGGGSWGGSGGVARAAALARRGVRKVERAGLDEDFQMSIAALEIERRPTGEGTHHEGGVQRLADGLHGGRPVLTCLFRTAYK